MQPVVVSPRPARARRRLVAALGVALVSVLFLWMLRTALLATALEWVLERQGLGPAEVEVAVLDGSRVVASVRRSALGEMPRIELEYRIGKRPALVVVERVRVVGARLRFAWRDGALVPSIASGGGTGAVPPSLQVVLEDCVVSLRVAGTDLVATVAGELRGGAHGTAALSFALDAPQGHASGRLRARMLASGSVESLLSIEQGDLAMSDWTLQGLRGEAQVQVHAQQIDVASAQLSGAHLRGAGQDWGEVGLSAEGTPARGWHLALRATPLRAELTTQAPTVDDAWPFEFDASGDPRALAALWPGARVAAGKLTLRAAGHWPAADIVKHARLQGELGLHATGLALPGLAQVAAVAARLDCALADGTLACRIPERLILSDVRAGAGNAPAAGVLTEPSTLTISPHDARAFLRLTHTPAARELSLDAVLGLSQADHALRMPLAVRLDFAAPDGLPPGGGFTLSGALESVSPPSGTLELAGRYTIDLARRKLLTVLLDAGSLDLPAYRWAVHELHGRYRDGATAALELRAGKLYSTAAPPVLAPLAIDLRAALSAGDMQLSATATDATQRIHATLEASHRRRDGTGKAHLVLKPLRIDGPAALRELSPAFAAGASEAAGELSVSGEAAWGAGPLRSQLSVALRDATLARATVRVSGMHMDLRFDSLLPLHAAPGQTLRAALDLPTLKSVPLTASFNVADGRLHIERARAEVFEGAFSVSDGEVALADGATRVALDVQDVNLEPALAVLNIEGLHGSGRLSGRLPLRFESGRIGVQQGHLEARDGVVQVGTRVLREQLQGREIEVEQALRALADFHYQHLSIDADKPLSGPGYALLRLAGSNPAVMQNQPFVFNIRLDTDFDYLAALLLQLSGASSSVLGWSAGQLIDE